jgi:catechol 2,3-dioxygenase-like lactoylglutathione lyase family enzyme
VDERFGDLARQVQAAARGMGPTAGPSRLRFVHIGIDAADIPAVRSFWRAVLGNELDERPDITDIYDPRRLNPAAVLPAPVRRRRSATSAAQPHPRRRLRARRPGWRPHRRRARGQVVFDAEAPEWWTLADPKGNEVDIVVSVGREEIRRAAQGANSQPPSDRSA